MIYIQKCGLPNRAAFLMGIWKEFHVLAGNDFSSYPVRDKLEHNGK